MKTIIINSPKHGRHEVLVDDDDYEYLNQFNWNINKSKHNNNFYVKRCSIINNKQKNIQIHRQILGLKCGDNTIVDHKDHNGLNNQRSNLRIATCSQNSANKIPRGISKYLGVCRKKVVNKRFCAKENKLRCYVYECWVARAMLKGKQIYIGHFKTEIDAAKAYDKKALELHGEFANLNFKD